MRATDDSLRVVSLAFVLQVVGTSWTEAVRRQEAVAPCPDKLGNGFKHCLPRDISERHGRIVAPELSAFVLDESLQQQRPHGVGPRYDHPLGRLLLQPLHVGIYAPQEPLREPYSYLLGWLPTFATDGLPGGFLASHASDVTIDSL